MSQKELVSFLLAFIFFIFISLYINFLSLTVKMINDVHLSNITSGIFVSIVFCLFLGFFVSFFGLLRVQVRGSIFLKRSIEQTPKQSYIQIILIYN